MGKYKRYYLTKKAEAVGKAEEKVGLAQVKSEERLKTKEIKSTTGLKAKELNIKRRLALQRLRQASASTKQRFQALKTIRIAPSLTNEQSMLQSMFGHGERCILPDELNDSLPQINGALIPSVINGDFPDEDNTSDSFGFGVQRHRTGEFFGI